MAKFISTAEATVTMNGKAAEVVLNTLKEKAKELRTQIKEIQKTDPNNPNLKKMEADLKRLESSASKVKQMTFEYGQVLKNLNGSTLKDLQKTKQILLGQIKSMTQGTKEYIATAKQLRQVDAQIGKINSSMKTQQSSIGRLADGFQKYFGMVATLTASIAMVNQQISKLTGYFKDWEKSFTNVLTLMNDADISKFGKSMEKGAIDVMKRYGLTIEDTNKALFDAVSAGIPAGEAIKFLDEAAKLAIGGVTSLSVSVDGMTSIIKAYSLETSEANKVTSAFFTAQKYGKTTVADLASGIGKIAPIARTAGLSFQEMLSAIAELTLRGISTDEAITALRGALSALLKPGKEAEAILRQFNVPIGMTEIRAAGLGKTLEALNKIILENPDAIAKAIPNLRGFTAITALSGEAIEHYDMILQDVNNDFGKTSYLSKAVAKQQETLAQRMARAKAEFVAYVLESDKLRDILSKLVFSTNKFLKLLLSIPSGVYLAAAAFGALVVVLKTYNKLLKVSHALWVAYNKIILLGMTGFYRLTGNITRAAAAWKLFNTGLSKTAIGALVVTIAALTTGIVSLFKSTDRAKEAYKEFREELTKEQSVANALFDSLKKANEGSELRKNLIDKINDKYGEYLGFLLNEKTSLDDIASSQLIVNSRLQEFYALKHKQSAEDDIREKYSVMQEDALESMRKHVASDKIVTKKDNGGFEISKEKAGDEFAELYVKEIKRIFSQEGSYTATGTDKGSIFLNPESLTELKNNIGELYKGGSALTNTIKEYVSAVITERTKLDEINKKFALVLDEPNNKPATDYPPNPKDNPDYYKELDDKVKDKEKEDEAEREKRFKARLAKLEQEQREERNAQARAYLQGKTDREEYNASIETIDYTYLLRRKMLYEQFGKETSEIDAEIMNVHIKLADSIYEKLKKANEDFLKFVKKGKEYLDKMLKDAADSDKQIADELAAAFLKKAEEANRIRDELRKGNIDEQMQYELDKLRELNDAKLLSDEEFEQAVLDTRLKHFMKYLQKAMQLQQAFGQMANAMQEAETAKVEAAEQQKLSALQNRYNQGLIGEEEYNAEKEKIEYEAAQKKLDIEKKYADVNFAIKVSEIIATTAVAIMQAYSQLGFVAGSVAAVMLAVTGAMQVKAAAAERDKVKSMTLDAPSGGGSTQQRVVLPGVEEGGYTEVERKQDGKRFFARRRKQRGYVGEPTALVGEAGAEFVANAEAVSNPTVRPVLDLINIAQQNGSVSSINLPKMMSSMYPVRGFADGGYTSETTMSVPAPAQNTAEIAGVMKEVRDLLASLKTNGVDAWVVLSQLQKQQAILEKSEKLGSRK